MTELVDAPGQRGAISFGNVAVMRQRGGRRGIASLCIGGGEATALAVERIA